MAGSSCDSFLLVAAGATVENAAAALTADMLVIFYTYF